MAVTTSVSDAVSFDRLTAFSDLFVTYCQDFGPLADYYSGDFRQSADRRAIADERAAAPASRDQLVEILFDQNERWHLDETTRRNIRALGDPESIAVVTGQQVGLFTGPLYTVYKTITTLQLAEKMEEETGRPVVPVFWLAGEDHDYDEVAELHLIKRNTPADVTYEEHRPMDGVPRGPVGRLVFGDASEQVFRAVEEGLIDTEFTSDLMGRLRETYARGTSLTDGFARLLKSFFPDSGLVFVSPDEAQLKRLAAPLWRKEVREYRASEERLKEVSRRLEESYHAQVYPRATNLFMLEEEGRFALEPTDRTDEFRLRGIERRFSTSELLDLVDSEPERFSPNVALRPLMQDYLLPTAAYVAGPGETAYFAQLKPLYEWMDMPMPIVYPRASVSIVEGKVRKVLDRYDLAIPDLQEDLGALFKRVVIEHGEFDVEGEYEEALKHVHRAVNEIKTLAEDVDQTLVSSAEATRAALMKEMDKLKQKIIRAEKRNHDEISSRLQKAQVGLFPERQLQERYVSVLYFLNKYSSSILEDWRETFSLDTTAHQVVDV